MSFSAATPGNKNKVLALPAIKCANSLVLQADASVLPCLAQLLLTTCYSFVAVTFVAKRLIHTHHNFSTLLPAVMKWGSSRALWWMILVSITWSFSARTDCKWQQSLSALFDSYGNPCGCWAYTSSKRSPFHIRINNTHAHLHVCQQMRRASWT